MECPNCGNENRDVALFCQHCGTSLAIAEPALAESAESTESPQEHVENLAPQAAPDTPVLVLDTDAERAEQAQDPAPEPQKAAGPAPESAVTIPGVDDETPVPDARPLDELVQPEPGDTETDVERAPESASEPPEGQNEPELLLQDAVAFPESIVETANGEDLELEEAPHTVPDASPAPRVSEEESEQPEDLEADQFSAPPLVEVQELADAHMLPWEGKTVPLEALALGTVLDGRYKVIEVTETRPTHIRYQVRDLQRCPRCGATGHHPDEAFCAACGALMDQKPTALMLQQPASNSQKPAGIEPEDQLVENEQTYWIWRETQGKDGPQVANTLMRLIVGLHSDTGQVRELDEDSIFTLTMSYTYESVTHQLGLFVVADGMGGHEGGEIASRLAIQTTAQILLRDLFGPELTGNALAEQDILDRITDAIRQANDEVYLERQKRDNDMGTTITAAYVRDWMLHLGHVGDCRAYRWGQQGLQQLTTDHSIVAGMVAAGTIQPEDIYTHPQRSVIYRCIGDQPTVEVDVSTVRLEPGERLIVCCDGLWEELRDAGIEDVLLAEADPQTACEQMVRQANVAGGSDNISVIIVQL